MSFKYAIDALKAHPSVKGSGKPPNRFFSLSSYTVFSPQLGLCGCRGHLRAWISAFYIVTVFVNIKFFKFEILKIHFTSPAISFKLLAV